MVKKESLEMDEFLRDVKQMSTRMVAMWVPGIKDFVAVEMPDWFKEKIVLPHLN